MASDGSSPSGQIEKWTYVPPACGACSRVSPACSRVGAVGCGSGAGVTAGCDAGAVGCGSGAGVTAGCDVGAVDCGSVAAESVCSGTGVTAVTAGVIVGVTQRYSACRRSWEASVSQSTLSSKAVPDPS